MSYIGLISLLWNRRDRMYSPTLWKDHVTSPANRYIIQQNDDGTYTIMLTGEIMQQGTPQDQEHFNNIEIGIYDSHLAGSMILNAFRQLQWENDNLRNNINSHTWKAQTGTITLKNTSKFPFNNSLASVALVASMPNINYIVMVDVVDAKGNVGDVTVSDKLTNGFKLSYDGSASEATIKYPVIGGYLE